MKFTAYGRGLAGVIALGVFTAGQPASAAEIQLTAVTANQRGNPLAQSFLKNYLAVVNARGKGVVQIRYVGGPEVVPPRNGAAALKRGQFDVLYSPTAYYIGAVPEGYGLLASNQTPAALRKNGGFEILKEIYRKKVGAELVAWGESATAYNTYLVVKPKFRPDGVPDLSGIKMRATGTYRPLFNALGASTINMKSSEIYTALQRGVVQGFGWPDVGIVALGLHSVVKYRIDPSFYQTNTVVTVNKAKWDSLPKMVKDVMNAVALDYEKTSRAFMEKARQTDDKALMAKGVKIIKLTGEARKKYLATAYNEVWKALEKRSDYAAKLRPKLYISD